MTIRDPELIRQWEEDGYVLLKQVVPHVLIDQLNAEVAAFRKTSGETKDEHGYGQRVGLFHARSRTSLQVAQNPSVRAFLTWAFREEPLLFGSLTFEAGTEQAAHQDSIFFFTNPDWSMAGSWVSLEDVHPDAGPLFYYKGSHRWGLDRAEAVWSARPDLHERVKRITGDRSATPEARQALAGELGNAWTDLLHKKIAARGAEPVPVVIRKGDALIWHAHLVHGGLPRKNRALSRRSMVSHHIGKSAIMFDMATFFLTPKERMDKSCAQVLAVQEDKLGAYVPHAKPVTY